MAQRLALYIALGLLFIDALFELSFITATVGWLATTAKGTFPVKSDGSIFDLPGKPASILLNQGHTSNGAAGTAVVIICLGGILSLWLRQRPNYHQSKFSKLLYNTWVVFNILGLLLTFVALIYVFTVTNKHQGQHINVSVAEKLKGEHYPDDTWTPQNWFAAVLELDLADSTIRSDINNHLKIMKGWQYNLIPMFLIQIVEATLAVLDFRARQREDRFFGGPKLETMEYS